MTEDDQWDAYKTATRPAWATALIIAGALFVIACLMLVLGMGGAPMLFAGAGVTAVVAGIIALARVKKA